MSKHTTTDVLASNIDPFSAKSAHRDVNGNKVYVALTWLDSETPNGRYEITKMGSRHYSVSHHQVIGGGTHKVVRYISFATTKEVAMRYAQLDSQDLTAKVFEAALSRKSVFSA